MGSINHQIESLSGFFDINDNITSTLVRMLSDNYESGEISVGVSDSENYYEIHPLMHDYLRRQFKEFVICLKIINYAAFSF